MTATAAQAKKLGAPYQTGWFIGYRGDLAFAVLVEGCGLGADSASPIINAFLSIL